MRLSVIQHLLLATILFTGILILGIVLISHVAVVQGVERMQQETAPETAEKIIGVLSLEEENLGRIAYDWGVWDDTYRFVSDLNGQYISSNLAIPSLIGIQVNSMLFFDPDGGLRYGVAADYVNGTGRAVPLDLAGYINRSGLYRSGEPVSGIVPLPSGPVMIATHPILQSNEEGEPRGTLVIGRDLDPSRVSYLSGYTLYPFTLEQRSGSQGDGLVDHTGDEGHTDLSGGMITTSGFVSDIEGRPALVARMKIPYHTPYTPRVLELIAILVIILSFLFFLVIFLYYRFFLIRHIRNLSVLLDRAGDSGAMEGGASGHAPPELSRLFDSAQRISRRLRQNRDELDHSAEVIREAEERWQILFEEAPDPMCVGDEEEILNANQAWAALFRVDPAAMAPEPVSRLSLPRLSDGTDPMTVFTGLYYAVPDDGYVRFDWRIPGTGDGDLYYDVTIKPIRVDGKVLRFVVAREITSQVRLQRGQEIAIARIDRNLVQLGALNDEIRNPLTVILGLVDDDQGPNRDSIIEQVQIIDAIIDRLDRGHLDSEKVRHYLQRSFDLGKR